MKVARLQGQLCIQIQQGIEYLFTIDVQSSFSRVQNIIRHRKRASKQERMFLLKTYSLLQPRKAIEVADIISKLYSGENREILNLLHKKDKEWQLPSTPFYTDKKNIYQFIYNNCVRESKKKSKKH